MYSPVPIEWLQRWSTPWLDAFFVAVTSLGSAPFYLLFVAFVYLALDRRAGLLVGYGILLSGFLNQALKWSFGHPRPPRELWKVFVDDPGFPSGHAQTSATFWPLVAWRFPRPWVIAACALLVVLVSLSRVYLGVHYAAQVLVGAAVGLAVAGAVVLGERAVSARLAALPLQWQVVVAVVAPLPLLLLYSGPHALEYVGGLGGLGAGYALERRGAGLLGGAGAAAGLVAFAGTAVVLSGLPQWWPLLYGRGFALMWLLSFGAPWLSRRVTRA